MPVYQSHVGAPDYEGVAARFKPFDLPSAVEKGMQAAAVMTSSIMAIQKQNAELNLMNVMAPIKVEEARTRVEMLQKEKQVYDLTHAPDRIKAKLDLESSQEALQTKLVRDESEFMNWTGEGDTFDQLQLAAKNDPAKYLAMRDGLISSPIAKNGAFRKLLSSLDSQVASQQYFGADKVAQSGGYLMSQWQTGNKDAVHNFSGMGAASRDTLEQVQVNTGRAATRATWKAQGATDDDVDKLFKVQEEQQKAQIGQIGRVADLTLKDLQLEERVRKAQTPGTLAPAPTPIESDIGAFGNLGDRDMGRAVVKTLETFKTQIQEQINKQLQGAPERYPMTMLQEKLAKINAVERQIVYAPTLGKSSVQSGLASLINWISAGTSGADEFDQFTAIRDKFSAARSPVGQRNWAKTKEAAQELAEWTWNFAMDKDLSVLQKQKAAADIRLRELQGMMPPQVGGTAPAAGGVPSFASVEEANASGYKGSATVMGRPAMIR